MDTLTPDEEGRLNDALAQLPSDIQELMKRREEDRREALRRYMQVGIMIRNFSHGAGRHLKQ